MPRVDEIVREVRVRVHPLVRDRVVPVRTGTIVGGETVPTRIRTTDFRIVIHRIHNRIQPIVGEVDAIGDAREEIVGLSGSRNLVVPRRHLGRAPPGPTRRNRFGITNRLVPDVVAQRILAHPSREAMFHL